MNTSNAIYGLGALLLGIVGLAVGDFALQWQPVPASLPLRVPLAWVSAAILVAGGVTVVTARTARIGALSLGLFYALWVVLLHAPRVVARPTDVSIWLGVAEILALALGGFTAWWLSLSTPTRHRTHWQLIRIGFGGCLLIFGASHFVYADFSATMIPGFLPVPLFWVWLTGAGHVAAGLSLVSDIATRLASTLLVAMFACFVILLHVPRVMADPGNRVEWTMLAIATALTGATWIVRTAVFSTASAGS